MAEPAIVSFLADYGFYEIFLPFILVFAIVFSVLQKTQILGRDKKRLNIGVALAISLIAIGSLQFSTIIQEFTAKLGFAIVILLGIALFLGFMGVPLHNKFTIAFAIIAFLGMVYAQFSSPAITAALSSFLTNGLVIGIIIVALIIYLFVRSPKKKEKPEAEKPGEFKRPEQPPQGQEKHLERLTQEQLKQKELEKKYK